MTAKRFEVYKVIGSFHEWSIEDNLNDKVVFGCIIHKYEADRLCGLLNELHEENEQLKYNLSAHMVDLNNYTGKCSALEIENEQLKKQVQKIHKLINSKIQSARELGSVRTVVALKDLQRDLNGELE